MVVVRPEKGYEVHRVNQLVWLGCPKMATGFRQPQLGLARVFNQLQRMFE